MLNFKNREDTNTVFLPIVDLKTSPHPSPIALHFGLFFAGSWCPFGLNVSTVLLICLNNVGSTLMHCRAAKCCVSSKLLPITPCAPD